MSEEAPTPRERRLSPFGRVAALAALIGAALLLVLIFAGEKPYTVKARFQSAGQLVKGNLVQIAGPPRRARSKSIELADDGEAEVSSRSSEHARAAARGHAARRSGIASLSGVANRYVDLQLPPGEAGRRSPTAALIPLADTTTAVDLDQLFALFDAKTRKGLTQRHPRLRRVLLRASREQANAGLGVPQPVARRRAAAVRAS